MKIEVYLDGNSEPIKVLIPPEKFSYDSAGLSDGNHVLTFKSIELDGRIVSQRTIPFVVQNGPAISVYGIEEDETVSGNLELIVNSYSSEIGDEFEPHSIESPTPIPTWTWILNLLIVTACAGFLAFSMSRPYYFEGRTEVGVAENDVANIERVSGIDDGALGKKVYSNNCASCHQENGTGLTGVFPPLVGNTAVLNEDPTDHINAVLNGLSNKIIDGVSYNSPMPGFGSLLSDEEISAVVNHERSNWGNSAKPVNESQVKALR